MAPKNQKNLVKKKGKEIIPSSSSDCPEVRRTNKKKDVSGTEDTGLLAFARLGFQLWQCFSSDDDVSEGNQDNARKGNHSREGNQDKSKNSNHSRKGNQDNSRRGEGNHSREEGNQDNSRKGNEDEIMFLKLANTLFVALSADLQGPTNADILFLPGATKDNYLQMIQEMRDKVTSGARTVAGIPVLYRSVQQRFIRVHLINHKWDTIVVTIDASNVYLVGCHARQHFYLLNLEKAAGKSTLFTYTTTRKPQELSGHYTQLEKNAEKSRTEISLGPNALHKSITSLLNAKDVKSIHESFLVIIQMVCESARFNKIAQQLGASFDRGEDFKPSTEIVELENKWSAYSKILLKADGSSINNLGGLALSLDSLHQDEAEASTSKSPHSGRGGRGGRGGQGGRRGRGRR